MEMIVNREMLDRFYVELTNPDEMGITDSRLETVFDLARQALSARPEEQRKDDAGLFQELYFKAQADKCEAQDVASAAYRSLNDLIAKIRAMHRYDCQGAEGDYDAGMEPGDGYVDAHDLDKILSEYEPQRGEGKP